jgi:hypothetical protein
LKAFEKVKLVILKVKDIIFKNRKKLTETAKKYEKFESN